MQTALNVASAIPFIGSVASLASAAIDLSAGNYVGAALGIAGAIPGVGSVRAVANTADVLLDVGRVARGAVADGKFYSVAFETTLSPMSYPGLTRYMHSKEANVALDVAMQSNPALAKLGISVPKSPTGSILGKSPENWVWHHDTAPGLMQLVPKSQHPNIPGGSFWETLHPGGVGGFSIWGK